VTIEERLARLEGFMERQQDADLKIAQALECACGSGAIDALMSAALDTPTGPQGGIAQEPVANAPPSPIYA
jgi:hypothetical protein